MADQRDLVHLGRPGSHCPVEQLGQLPETRALLANPLNLRSVGIKDLRYGYLTDECWEGQDCNAWLRNSSRDAGSDNFVPASNTSGNNVRGNNTSDPTEQLMVPDPADDEVSTDSDYRTIPTPPSRSDSSASPNHAPSRWRRSGGDKRRRH